MTQLLRWLKLLRKESPRSLPWATDQQRRQCVSLELQCYRLGGELRVCLCRTSQDLLCILQTIPLWSAISEVAWDTCKGTAIWRTTPPWHPRGWGAQSRGLEMNTRALEMSPSFVLLGESHLCLVGPRSGQFKTGADWTTKPAPVLGLLLLTVTPQWVFAWNQWKSIHWLASRPRKYMEDGGVCCNKCQRFQRLAQHS